MTDEYAQARDAVGHALAYNAHDSFDADPPGYRDDAERVLQSIGYQLLLEERDSLRSMAGKHDPTGADHMEEMMVASEERDKAEDILRKIAELTKEFTEPE